MPGEAPQGPAGAYIHSSRGGGTEPAARGEP